MLTLPGARENLLIPVSKVTPPRGNVSPVSIVNNPSPPDADAIGVHCGFTSGNSSVGGSASADDLLEDAEACEACRAELFALGAIARATIKCPECFLGIDVLRAGAGRAKHKIIRIAGLTRPSFFIKASTGEAGRIKFARRRQPDSPSATQPIPLPPSLPVEASSNGKTSD